jgi:hypothetical protein
MHETRSPEFIGYVDRLDTDLGMTSIRGWVVGLKENVSGCEYFVGDQALLVDQERKDVAEWYKTGDEKYVQCGFEVAIPYPGPSLRVWARNGGTEFPIFDVQVPESVPVPEIKLTTMRPPQFVVVDDFYQDPDAIREFALEQEFREDQNYYRGRRTLKPYLFPGIRERFETLLNTQITRWEDMPVNGVFQYCTSQDALVYHADTQMYAATIYLTPDAPPQCGTSLYRSRAHPKVRRWPQDGYDYAAVFPTGHFDRTKFELIDTVGNVYNRLVIWDAKLLHSASEYFGEKLENSRLFHLFFFDIKS